MENIKTSTADSYQAASNKNLFVAGLLDLSKAMSAAGSPQVLFTEEDIHSPTWDLFDQMNDGQQKKILNDFEVYAGLMKSVIAANKDFSDNTSTLWAAIKALGVMPSSDLFTNLEPDDVIEIYRNDNLQVFRNMRFHNICSYHLHDLFIRSWPDLFVRDEYITGEIVKAAISVFQGVDMDKFENLDYLTKHNLFEKDSPGMYVMEMQLRFISPLKDKAGNILYAVAASKVEVVKQEKSIPSLPELNF